jgi:hypothetical protein
MEWNLNLNLMPNFSFCELKLNVLTTFGAFLQRSKCQFHLRVSAVYSIHIYYLICLDCICFFFIEFSIYYMVFDSFWGKKKTGGSM